MLAAIANVVRIRFGSQISRGVIGAAPKAMSANRPASDTSPANHTCRGSSSIASRMIGIVNRKPIARPAGVRKSRTRIPASSE
jgi:hypothetical protein